MSVRILLDPKPDRAVSEIIQIKPTTKQTKTKVAQVTSYSISYMLVKVALLSIHPF